tara:strand:- start:1938 stop:2474 length:537 start_codon:yes stop_codon:yes gene_type:complete
MKTQIKQVKENEVQILDAEKHKKDLETTLKILQKNLEEATKKAKDSAIAKITANTGVKSEISKIADKNKKEVEELKKKVAQTKRELEESTRQEKTAIMERDTSERRHRVSYINEIENENEELNDMKKSIIKGEYNYKMGIKHSNEIKITITSNTLSNSTIEDKVFHALSKLAFITLSD